MNLSAKKELLKLARDSIQAYFSGKEIATSKFKEKKGVFVSIYSNNKLLGCIGYVFPIKPLGKAVIECARLAAFSDPRFPSLKRGQKYKLEISVLSKPKLIKEKEPKKILSKIKLGKHGIIIDFKGLVGVLLPQVAVEHKLSKEAFLEACCHKAFLHGDCWKSKDCRVYIFTTEIIKERKEK